MHLAEQLTKCGRKHAVISRSGIFRCKLHYNFLEENRSICNGNLDTLGV